MKMENKLPKRKHPRLNDFDYSSNGAYFITVCTQNRRCTLSRIVGRGLAPAETSDVKYTSFGKIAEQQLLLLEKRYNNLTVDKYVIMPNHIHAILILDDETAGASPRPTDKTRSTPYGATPATTRDPTRREQAPRPTDETQPTP